MSRRLTLTAAGIGVAGLLLTGCFPTGAPAPEKTPPASTQEAEMTDPAPVVESVKSALPEALQVEVEPIRDGLTGGWLIHAEVPLGYVVTGDALQSVLVAAWNASEPKPAFVAFNPWSTFEGKEGAIEAQRAADELGIDWSPSFSVGVNVPDYEIEKLAGE
ncbi:MULTISPECIES: hypothetical protein [unclassified Microbacterium]|uniref:hypothetical protein n=2 Tax=Bacteria TaxID=2 RepID=UPI000CFF0FC2|nr:hypothetical protein [Microbacterium sp. MYb45]PRB57547.1 hypothetical protein CQ034_17480 [Microbacterium sp. MYb45]